MIKLLSRMYRYCFARPAFFKVNSYLHLFSLYGMGILNWESDQDSGEAAFLKGYLGGKSQATVIDVGAHDGNYIRSVSRLGDGFRIFGFEPHPTTFQRLRASITLPTVKLINAGVGSVAASMSLFDYSTGDGSQHASLLRGVIEKIHGSEAVEHVVDVVTLDDFASSEGLTFIDLLKIDTEGNELSVLQGAARLLENRSIGAVQFEFNAMNVISRTFMSDFIEILENYDIYRLLPRGKIEIKSHDARLHEIFAFQNIVAILRS